MACVTLLLAPAALALLARPELTLREYRSALQHARAEAVAALRKSDARAVRSGRQERILAGLPVQASVRTPSGALIRIDNAALVQPLLRAYERPGTASRRLELRQFVNGIDRLLAATRSPTTELDRARADGVLHSVLRRPEYKTVEPGPSLEERIVAWLDRMIRRLIPGSVGLPAGGEGLGRLMLAVVVLLLAILVARIVVLILPDLRRRRRVEPEREAGVLVLPTEPEALLAAAEAEAAAGRYREALRMAYLAMVARLNRAGVLPEDSSRTHWELLRALQRAEKGALYQQLAPVTRRVDERLFGGRASTADDYQSCRQAYDQIERLLCAPA
jgi:hypothetical protein